MRNLTLVAATLILTACGNDHTSRTPPAPAEPPLAVTGLTHEYYDSYDLTKPCEGLEEFFKKFIELHMAEVSVERLTCGHFMSDTTVTLTVRANEKRLDLWYGLQESASGKQELTVSGKKDEMALVSPALPQLLPSLKHFVEPHPELIRIFGLTYPEFLIKAIATLEAKGLEHNGGDQRVYLPVKFQHAANSDRRTGSLSFHDIPEDIRTSPGFLEPLNCHEVACLSDGSIRYRFYRSRLIISRTHANGAGAFALSFLKPEDVGLR